MNTDRVWVRRGTAILEYNVVSDPSLDDEQTVRLINFNTTETLVTLGVYCHSIREAAEISPDAYIIDNYVIGVANAHDVIRFPHNYDVFTKDTAEYIAYKVMAKQICGIDL